MIDIKVPTVGESISEVTLLKWNKKDGEYVERDEVIAELESEKATFEVNAEQAGTLTLAAKEGDTLKIGDLLASIDDSAEKPEGSQESGPDSYRDGSQEPEKNSKAEATKSNGQEKKGKKEEKKKEPVRSEKPAAVLADPVDVKATPVASAMIADKKLEVSSISPSGAGGKIRKEDVLAALSQPGK